MLIKCPECELQVSDKAVFCPHCGYPFQNKTKNPTRGKSRMRLPNGFGQITKISSKPLRNPWRVMVHVGTDPNTGRPKQSLLKPKAYFASYNEAYQALVEYNRNPYDLSDDITMTELYNRWLADYDKKEHNASTRHNHTLAWKHCSELYNMRVKDVRGRHIRACIENDKGSANTKSRMKSLLHIMFDYALEYEIVQTNYARELKMTGISIDADSENKEPHVAFSDEELAKIWALKDERAARMVLIQTYMGWRPQELCLLEAKKIKDGFVCGGIKTRASRNRIVPIHPAIKDLVVPEGDMIFENLNYDKYAYAFRQLMKKIGSKHRCHDPRKTFITLAKRYGVDEYALKRMVGHNIKDLTERVYTERDPKWLYTEICKIQV